MRFPFGDNEIPLPGVSGELTGWGVEEGATPTNWVSPLSGEEAESGTP